MGQSGEGKSVLLKQLVGLLKPDSGQIFIGNREITRMSQEGLLGLRKEIGYLFQEGALYDFMTVFENIAFPLREHTVLSKSEISEKVKAILKLIDLKDVEDKYPAELSGGMKKRVALALAIVFECKVLYCDEPTSRLDPIRSRDIMDLIKNVSRAMKCTTVIASHDIQNSFRIADRIMLIHAGKIEAMGSPQELEQSQNKMVKEFIV